MDAYPNVTVAQVCDIANVSKSTFYRCFHDVLEVFESLIDDLLEHCELMLIDTLITKQTSKEEMYEYLSNFIYTEKYHITIYDLIVSRYIFGKKDYKILSMLEQKVTDILCSYLLQAGYNEECSRFYSKFCSKGSIVDTLTKFYSNNRISLESLSIVAELFIDGGLNGK